MTINGRLALAILLYFWHYILCAVFAPFHITLKMKQKHKVDKGGTGIASFISNYVEIQMLSLGGCLYCS